MVPGYRHVPGNHCGSTALRNLLAFHGCEISEEMAFGLGAGACFFYFPLDGPVADALHQRARRAAGGELPGADRGAAAAAHRSRSGRAPGRWRARRWTPGGPALLLTDLYYLDHYGNSAHFPGHAVVLAGYDAEDAWLSDTGFEELQTTELAHLAEARHSKHPAYPLDGPDGGPARRAPSSTREAAAGGRAARRSSARPARCWSRRWASSRACRRCERLADEVGGLARGGRGLAVVRALPLPGDRAPRHRRRQLPAHVLALPGGGGLRGVRRSPPRPRELLDRAREAARGGERGRRGRAASSGRRSAPSAGAVLEAERRLWAALAVA